jgi:SAM-dependent methyltransferase
MGQSCEPAKHDFDGDPGRFAANQLVTQNFSMVGDVHDRVAHRLARTTAGPILDLGGGNGTLAKSLAKHGRSAIVVDRADYVRRAPRPAVQADATRLPFRAECFAAVAALWMLYYLDRPEVALIEAARVLHPAGTFVACTSSRYNDPEFAAVLPNWGEPFSFPLRPRPRSSPTISRSPRWSGGICLLCGSPTPLLWRCSCVAGDLVPTTLAGTLVPGAPP